MKTRIGTKMRGAIRDKVVRVMTDPQLDGASQRTLAKAAGIGVKTLRNYLTPEVWAEIKERRLHVVHNAIGDVDRAVLAKALLGDIAAARLLYARWDKMQAEQLGQGADLPATLEEIEAELREIQAELALLEKPAA